MFVPLVPKLLDDAVRQEVEVDFRRGQMVVVVEKHAIVACAAQHSFRDKKVGRLKGWCTIVAINKRWRNVLPFVR